jgi:hypothetical protein
MSTKRRSNKRRLSRKRWEGKMLAPSHTPVWEPLLDLAPDHIDDFMWMFEVEIEDGTRLHAYKHWWSRGYLHLAADGRAFVYEEPNHYRKADRAWLLQLVLPSGELLISYDRFLQRARQDSNLRPLPPEGSALSS